MDGFLYYRVPLSSILQFAQLAINSNEHHPAHQRNQTANQTSTPSPTPTAPVTRWDLHLIVQSTISSFLPPCSPFPLPLTSLILDYCLLHSFVSGEAHGTYRLWSADGELAAVIDTPHTDYASSVACLPDSDTIVTGSWDGLIHLFRPQPTAPPEATPAGHAAHSSDGESGAASDAVSEAVMLETWVSVGRIVHKYEVHALTWAFVPHPAYEPPTAARPSPSLPSHIVGLLVASSASTLDIYDASSLRLLHQLAGHTAKLTAIAVLPPSTSSALSSGQPIGSRVITCSWDGDCRLWDLQRLECEAVLKGVNSALTCVACTSRGLVVAGDVKGRALEWSITHVQRAAPGGPEARARASDASSSSVASVTFASSSAFPNVFSFPHPPPMHRPVALTIVPCTLAISLPSPSPLRALLPLASSHLLLASDDGLRLYSLVPSALSPTPALVQTLSDDSRDQRVYALLQLSSGRVAAGMGGKRVALWNVEALCAEGGQAVLERRLDGLSKSVRCLALREQLDITV